MKKNLKGIVLVGFYVLTYTLLQLLCTAVIMLVGVVKNSDGINFNYFNDIQALIDELMTYMVNNLYLIMILSMTLSIIIYIGVSVLRERPIGTMIYHHAMNKKQIIGAILMGLGVRGVVSAYFCYIQGNDLFVEAIESSKLDVSDTSSISLLLLMLVVLVLGPVFEEILFRGLVMFELRRFMPSWLAIVIQATIFGVAHMNPPQIIFAIFAGIYFGIIYLKTKSLNASIISHCVFNITAMITLENASVQYGIIAAVVGIVLIYLAMKCLNKKVVIGG